MGWIKVIFEILMEVLNLSGQIAENQGKKIPLKTEEIAARSDKRAGEIREDSKKDDWLKEVRIYSKYLKPRWELHAKNQVSRVIDSGKRMHSVRLATLANMKTKKEEKKLILSWYEDDCIQEYEIPAMNKNFGL